MLCLAVIPIGLILLQPDLGTAVVLGFMILATIAVSGAPFRWIVGLMLLAVLGGVGLGMSGKLHGYQAARITVFVNPNATDKFSKIEKDDPQHSQIAIGSGGIFGQGLFHGPLTNTSTTCTAPSDDFIFTVAGEELGFAGCVGIVGLARRRSVAGVPHRRQGRRRLRPADRGGHHRWFAFQAFENIGMNLGIMPVTGLPAAVRLLRRLVDVRQPDGDRPAAERAHAHPGRLDLTRPWPTGRSVGWTNACRVALPPPRAAAAAGSEADPVRRRRAELAPSRTGTPADVRWCLMYPDAYEVGLPNQGVMILYEVLNERADVLAERTYACGPTSRR